MIKLYDRVYFLDHGMYENKYTCTQSFEKLKDLKEKLYTLNNRYFKISSIDFLSPYAKGVNTRILKKGYIKGK